VCLNNKTGDKWISPPSNFSIPKWALAQFLCECKYAGHVKDLSFCLKDPSEIELIENGLHVLASVQASMKNSQYQTKLSLYQYEPLSRKIKIRH
jgi:hypothetical protein